MARDKTDKTDLTPATSAMRRKVRGLLDVVQAEAEGEAWELEASSSDFVPGMGLGATKEATRWAWRGYQLEMSNSVKARLKRPAHRPKKPRLANADALRAYSAWNMCQKRRASLNLPDGKVTSRQLIGIIQAVERDIGIPLHDRLFSASEKTNEQSLSRGKALLEIDAHWNSAVCEELQQSFAQTT
jgi:hypothetical protein